MATNEVSCLGRKVRAQKRYRQTLKGEITEEKYEKSSRGRKRKREWAAAERLKKLQARKQKFIAIYGDIETALDLLDDKQRIVIKKIYGLDGNMPIKEAALAAEWGTSRQWINQIKKSAISKLNDSISVNL